MNDRWKTPKQHKDERIQQTVTALADRVAKWDAEIRTARLWMAKKMLALGSWEALGEWMKSDEPDAKQFRQYVEKTGHRWHIGQLYHRLRVIDLEEIRSAIGRIQDLKTP